MRNLLIALSLISIGTTSSLHAQSNRYDWGIEGGPNLSFITVKGSTFLDPEPTIQGSGGFIFQYNTKKILSFKTGFSYQRKGYQFKDITFTDNAGNYIGTGKVSSRFDYITLPILVKASFGKKVKFFVNAGPYVGFLLQQTDRTKINGATTTDQADLNAIGINRWDFGVAGGIGVAIPIKEVWMIHVEARNYTGLMNINLSIGNKLYTNTTDLRVGVVYRLGFRDAE